MFGWKTSSLFLCVVLVKFSYVKGRASISSNGYSDLVVAISPDTPESPELVDQIKSLMTEASRELYIASRNRAYFKKIKILLPKTWTTVEFDIPLEEESYETAEIRVDRPNSLYGDTPYTLTGGKCGVAGSFLHLTPTFMEGGTAVYGNWGKVLVHEWAKLRWGVFEEHGYPGDSTFPMFFYRTTWTVSGQRNVLTPNFDLNSEIVGYEQDLISGGACSYNEDKLPDHNCYYYATQETQATSSYMSLPYLSSNVNFCDDTEQFIHNPDLPNRHNFFCEGRSTWDVITSSPDFAEGSNPPDNSITNTGPEFVVVGTAREVVSYVLVLDISRSMQAGSNDYNADRITTMCEAAKRWVKYELADGVQVGIVLFSDEDFVVPLQNLTLVTDVSRDQMVTTIHTIYDMNGARTCIGCGLAMAANYTGMLGGKRGNTIVLITDGNQLCFSQGADCIRVEDTIGDLVERNIRVITIALGPDADPEIEDLAAQTGGKAFFVQDHTGSGGINDAFTGSTTYQPGDTISNSAVTVYQKDWTLDNDTAEALDQFADSFEVDETLGRDLVMQVDVTLPRQEAECVDDLLVLLIAPDDTHTGYNYTFKCDQSNFGLFRLDLQELQPPKMSGLWVYRITVRESMRVSVSVTGKSKDANTDPILTECWIQSGGQELGEDVDLTLAVRAEVRQGNKPVLGAKVTAQVERPSDADGTLYPAVEVDLLDNGCGADTVKNDGAYTRYFTKYTGKGRYSVKCQVVSDNMTQVNEGFTTARKRVLPGEPGPRLCCGSDTVNPDTILSPAGMFQRQAAAGSFQITTDLDLSVDRIAPARVTDLKVIYSQTEDDTTLTLTFTAPGDDLDSDDPVTFFMIKYSLTPGNLTSNNFDDTDFNWEVGSGDLLPGSSLTPPKGGETVTLHINPDILDRDNQYSFALRSSDESDNQSPVSNIGRTFMVKSLPLDRSSDSTRATAGIVLISAVVLMSTFSLYSL